MPLFVVATLLHSWTAWRFTLISVAFYVVDKLDFVTRAQAVQLVSMRTLRDAAPTVALKLRVVSGVAPTPGTSVSINIPSISWTQWHPFTVSDTGEGAGGAESGAWTHHIQPTGRSRWTDQLLQLVRRQEARPETGEAAPKVRAIWWPCNHIAQSYHAAHGVSSAVLLLAGGVGITPISALITQLLEARDAGTLSPVPPTMRLDLNSRGIRQASVNTPPADLGADLLGARDDFAAGDAPPPSLCLLWSVRSPHLVLEFLPLLERLARSPRTTLHINLTGTLVAPDELGRWPPWLRACVQTCRADIPAVLSTMIATPKPATQRLCVCACGPPPFERAIVAACSTQLDRGADVCLTRMSVNL